MRYYLGMTVFGANHGTSKISRSIFAHAQRYWPTNGGQYLGVRDRLAIYFSQHGIE